MAFQSCDRRFKLRAGSGDPENQVDSSELYSLVLTELVIFSNGKIHFIYFGSFFFFDTKSKFIRVKKLTK